MNPAKGGRLIRWLRHDAWSDLLELALVAALGAGLAYGTSLAIAPRAIAAPGALAEATQAQSGAQAERELFGVARAGSAAPARVMSNLVLLGVLSGPDSRGRAILAGVGNRPAIVSAGEAVGDGIVLQEVHPDHVVIVRHGVPERIALERSGPQASPPSAPVRPPAPR
jgi:type II secretory pathway component PulC